MSVGSFAIPKIGSPANVLREYTTGGTWSKPTHSSFKGVWVFAAGGGGSGGAGLRNSSVASGGSGGGGGATVRVWIPEASLGTTETYAIGAGAAGPAIGAGGAGGATLFGLHVEAKGGDGGAAGSTIAPTQAVGGSALLCTPVGAESVTGAPGGRGRRETENSLVTPYAGNAIIHSFIIANGSATNSPAGGAGGGGGGGYINTLPGGLKGGDGGGAYNNSTLTNGGAGGAAGGGNGTAGVSDIYVTPFLGLPVTTTIGLGTGGGGGGGVSGATNGGAGANGGRAAGGGGGGGTGTGTRGAGGAGGNGFLIVYEVFAQ
jgi:hypothetical protein